MYKKLIIIFAIISLCSISFVYPQSLHVDGYSGTLVANIGQMPYIDLSPGTYTVSVTGSGIKADSKLGSASFAESKSSSSSEGNNRSSKSVLDSC